jgi:Zn-dependent peptidase ImmA (M78 family)
MYSKGAKAAIQLLIDQRIDNLHEASLEDLVYAEGGVLEEKAMAGAAGRIIFGAKYAVISINKEITAPGRKRFVLAHELGHLKMHRKLERFFNCDEKAFMEWHKSGSHETEANEFAAELLMPRELFKNESGKSTFSVSHILRLAELFKTSVTSTAIRYAELGKLPTALFYCRDGKIIFYKLHPNFICKYPRVNEDVGSTSIASKYFTSRQVTETPTLVLPKVWFKDFDLKSDQYFYEQCFPIARLNVVMSFVWPCDLNKINA